MNISILLSKEPNLDLRKVFGFDGKNFLKDLENAAGSVAPLLVPLARDDKQELDVYFCTPFGTAVNVLQDRIIIYGKDSIANHASLRVIEETYKLKFIARE
jgi:hypothetical protein